MSDPLQKLANKLKAVADPQRLRIIQCLRRGEMHVTALANLLHVEIVNVSHHLGVLKQAQFVTEAKRGRFVFYALNPDVFSQSNDAATVMDLGDCKVELPYNPVRVSAAEPAAAVTA